VCHALPSRREGYGLVVVEAAARGTPSVVVADPDNAAVELIAPGENGVVAPSASPEGLAAAILRVVDEGEALRERTRGWFAGHARELSLESSLARVVEAYG
jgi:glycosyltransferase involved in cell wall biosynthesis